jgi:hypothetical protein
MPALFRTTLPKNKSQYSTKSAGKVSSLGRMCQALGIPEPLSGVTVATGVKGHCFADSELVVLISTRDHANDLRRANLAAIEGWRVLWCTATQWASGEVLKIAKRAL